MRTLQKSNKETIRLLSRVGFLPRVTIDGSLSTKNKLFLAFSCFIAYFLLQNVPLFGLISVLEYSLAIRSTNSVVRLMANAQNNILIAARSAVSIAPLIADFIIHQLGIDLTPEEESNFKNSITSVSLLIHVFRTWYNLFFYTDYLKFELNPYYVLTLHERYIWIVRLVVPLELVLAGLVLYVIEELVQKSQVTSILAIGYMSQTLSKVVGNLPLLIDYQFKMFYGLIFVFLMVAILEFYTTHRIPKIYFMTGSKFQQRAVIHNVDGLSAISEGLYLSKIVRDIAMNASKFLDLVSFIIHPITRRLLRRKNQIYSHAWVMEWLLSDQIDKYPIGLVLEKWYLERQLSKKERWVLLMNFLDHWVLNLFSFTFLRYLVDPSGSSSRMVDKDLEYKICVEGVPRQRVFQEKYYSRIVYSCTSSGLMFLILLPLSNIYGVCPYNLITPEELVVNHARILSLKNNITSFRDVDLPYPLLKLKEFSKDIPSDGLDS